MSASSDQAGRDFAGKVAFVTGASRGIGAATARILGRRGAAVGVNYMRSEAAAKAVVSEIEGFGSAAVMVQADVTKTDELSAAVDAVEEELLRRSSRVEGELQRARLEAKTQEIEGLKAQKQELLVATGLITGRYVPATANVPQFAQVMRRVRIA